MKQQQTIIINAIAGKNGGWIELINGLMTAVDNSNSGRKFIFIVTKELELKLNRTAHSCKVISFSTNYKNRLSYLFKRLYISIFVAVLTKSKNAILYSLGNTANFLVKNQILRVSNSLPVCDIYSDYLDSNRIHSNCFKDKLKDILLKSSVQYAKIVVVPSAFMKKRITKVYDASEEKIVVIKPGIKSFNVSYYADPIPRVPILLDTSMYGIHKNYTTLYKTLLELNKRGVEIKANSFSVPADYSYISDLVPHEVKLFDDCVNKGILEIIRPLENKDDLYQLFAISTLWISTSISEALSYTALDAQQFNIPLVAADIPINREVLSTQVNFFSRFDFIHCADICENAVKKPKTSYNVLTEKPMQSWDQYLDDFCNYVLPKC